MTQTLHGGPLTVNEIGMLRGELERELRRLESDDVRAHAFREALRRIKDGTYGTCLACGEGILFARLWVVPETRYCMACGSRQ